jgi:hypothetical protein
MKRKRTARTPERPLGPSPSGQPKISAPESAMERANTRTAKSAELRTSVVNTPLPTLATPLPFCHSFL